MSDLKIGLFGFGIVGEGIYRVLQQKSQLGASIKKIVIKHPDKQRNAPSELFSTDKNAILNDAEIDVVVELIDDADAAYEIVKTALQSGKSVVSANKKMIAEHHQELIRLQNENKVSFLYEAAVCGSVPILRNLEEYFDNDLLNYVRGIVNGSTNYILTQMSNGNDSYDSALKSAQENGFAESNPSLDVEGIDASYKLSIITLHAFGKFLNSEKILKKGITAVKKEDFNYAKEKGYAIKLIAQTSVNSKTEELDSAIFPTFVKKTETLALVNNEYNGVLIGSSLADEQFLYGKGAGRYPTSSAVLSDISALKYGYKYELRKQAFWNPDLLNQGKKQKFYLGFCPENKVDLDFFTKIHEEYRSENYHYVVGEIDFQNLYQSDFWKNTDYSLIAFE